VVDYSQYDRYQRILGKVLLGGRHEPRTDRGWADVALQAI
jgi:hypothetical protein